MVTERTKVAAALGIAVACAAAAGLLAVSEPGPLFGQGRPPEGSVLRYCSGALVALTYDATAVPTRARVLISDPGRRVWRVRSGGVAGPVPSVAGVTDRPIAVDDSTFLVRAWLRPSTSERWCRVSVDLTPDAGILY